MIIGIDPGVSGAMAILNDEGEAMAVEDMPTIARTKGKGGRRMVDAAALAHQLSQFPDVKLVLLERVSTRPGEGHTGAFAFGDSWGVARGVCAALGFPLMLVTPQSWKRRAGLIGSDKEASRALAAQLWPNINLSRKKDQNRAEAMLIARYGQVSK